MENIRIKPIHPFPARMAPAIIWEKLPDCGKKLRVLDPMAGSGTTLVSARMRGHEALGCDTDPLALLVTQAWCSDIETNSFLNLGKDVVKAASSHCKRIDPNNAYPDDVDSETRDFLTFWFDVRNRIELTALADCISRIESPKERNLLWCAFSRLIITKKTGASLAMDVSHSRPHRVYKEAPVRPIERFLYSVKHITDRAPFTARNSSLSNTAVINADARSLPFEDSCIDIVITSPPYLNAIDYLRGHKLSLVWMGYSISGLRSIRASNIGSEASANNQESGMSAAALNEIVDINLLKRRTERILLMYFSDMMRVIREIRRVLRKDGVSIIVVGDSFLEGVKIRNSEALKYLGKNLGFKVVSEKVRPIPDNRRYLPPPSLVASGSLLEKRIRNEVILTLKSTI